MNETKRISAVVVLTCILLLGVLALFTGVASADSHSVSASQETPAPLDNWNGTWVNVGTMLDDPAMNAVYEAVADAANAAAGDGAFTTDDARSFIHAMHETNFGDLGIAENNVTYYNTDGTVRCECEYESAGVETVTFGGEEFDWYKFELTSEDTACSEYKYLIFTEVHSHEGGMVHWHMRYGNTSFNDLINNTNYAMWWPTFGVEGTTAEEAAEGYMSGAEMLGVIAAKELTYPTIPTIPIYDEESLLKISIEDVGKYHGDIGFCVVVGFRATQLAISQLWQDEIPKREDFKIICAFPGKGSQDAFEFITRAKTRKDFTLKLPEGTSLSTVTIDNLVFTFIRKSTGKQIKVWMKEAAFPPEGSEEIFRLRKKVKFEKTATPEEKEAFKSAAQGLKKAAMSLPLDSLFGFKLSTAEVIPEKGKLAPILIYDRICFEKVPLEISIEDIRKYRGNICPGVVFSFRATQLAISQLWKDEIPERGDFEIISTCPFPCSQASFEFLTRAVTREGGKNFKIELPKGTDIKNITKDNFVFIIIRKSTGDSIKIRLREELFSERFFQLRKKKIEGRATPEEIKELKSIKQEFTHTFMNLPMDRLFESEKEDNLELNENINDNEAAYTLVNSQEDAIAYVAENEGEDIEVAATCPFHTE